MASALGRSVLQRYSKGRAEHSPSQVIRLAPGDDGDWTVDEVYLGRGETLSGSSVAAVRGDRL